MKPQDSPKSVVKQAETPVKDKEELDPPSSIKKESASSIEFAPDPDFL